MADDYGREGGVISQGTGGSDHMEGIGPMTRTELEAARFVEVAGGKQKKHTAWVAAETAKRATPSTKKLYVLKPFTDPITGVKYELGDVVAIGAIPTAIFNNLVSQGFGVAYKDAVIGLSASSLEEWMYEGPHGDGSHRRQTITLTNTGSESATFVLGTPSATWLVVAATGSLTLAAGAHVHLNVDVHRYLANNDYLDVDDHVATFTISTTDGANSPQTVTVTNHVQAVEVIEDVAIAHGDTEETLGSLTSGSRIIDASFNVTEAFNGTPVASVGVLFNPEMIMTRAEMDTLFGYGVQDFQTTGRLDKNIVLPADADVKLYLSQTNGTTGHMLVGLYYVVDFHAPVGVL